MMYRSKIRGIFSVLCIVALLANTTAVYTHILCFIGEEHAMTESGVVASVTDDHAHHCSHATHHEPVSERQKDDHCTPCINDHYDFTEKARNTDRVLLSFPQVTVSIISFHLPKDTHRQIHHDCTPEMHPAFMPQYPPLKTVILS